MATPLGDALFQSILDMERAKRRDIGRAIMAAPAALNAARSGNVGAAQAAVERFFPAADKSNQVTRREKLDLKADLLKLLDDQNKVRLDSRLSAADKMKAQDDALIKLLEVAGKAAGDQASSTATVRSSANQLISGISEKFIDYQIKALELIKEGQGSAVSKGLQTLEETLRSGGADAGADIQNVENISSIINGMANAGNFGGIAVLKEQGDRLAQQYEYPSMDAWLESVAGVSGTSGEQAMIAMQILTDPRVVTKGAEVMEDASKLVEAQKQAALMSMFEGSSNVSETFKKVFMDMLPLIGGEPGKDGTMGEQIDQILGEQDKTTPEAVAKLLDEIDKDDLPEASTYAEARRRLLNSPGFKKWMEDNGFQDPIMALKEAKRIARSGVQSAKAHDRQLVAARREAEVGPQTNTGPASAAAVSKNLQNAKMQAQVPVLLGLDPTALGEMNRRIDATPTEPTAPELGLAKKGAGMDAGSTVMNAILPSYSPGRKIVDGVRDRIQGYFDDQLTVLR